MATTKSSLRTDRFIWYVRLIQTLFVLVILGIAAQSSLVWVNDAGCSTPQRLALNIACAALTLILLLYFIPTTGPLSLTPLWSTWVQIGLDVLFLILWIAATATSSPDCGDLCSACSSLVINYGGLVVSGNVECICSHPSTDSAKRGLTSLLAGRGASTSATVTAEKAAIIAMKQGFDAALVLLFAITVGYGLYKASNASRAEEKYEQHQTIKTAEAVVQMVD